MAAVGNVRAGAGLWAITSYFNSAGLARRRENYRQFRNRLSVPLLAVEHSCDGRFELEGGDADILIQVRGGDPMWQKERLLNLGLAALPADCRYVAWIDCDVIFARPDWPELAIEALDRYALVQLFRSVHYLARDGDTDRMSPEAAYTSRTAMAFGIGSGLDPLELFEEGNVKPFSRHAPGFAWAARRELLDALRFFDTCIVGGGDRALLAAVHDCIPHMVSRQRMTPRHAEQYVAWAGRLRDLVAGATGSIEGDLYHLWHGSVHKRRMRERYHELARFAFNPEQDLALADGGAWGWATDKPEMHEMVGRHLVIRCEDA